MKKDKETHKKGKESTIGKIIYGFLMFMPLLAIGFTCLYAVFNNNARDSFNGTIQYKETTQVQQNDVFSGRNYYSLTKLESYSLAKTYNITNLVIRRDNQIIFNSQDYNYNYFAIKSGGYQYDIVAQETQYVDSEPTIVQLLRIGTYQQNYFINTLIMNSPKFEGRALINTLYFDTYYVNTKLNDVFYYGVDSVEKSTLFNWATNSSLYNVIHNTCTDLSITTTFVPLLLTYWLIISLIYFIYDIILIILNILHRKIHELQDSI